jgi:hypothetical protein
MNGMRAEQSNRAMRRLIIFLLLLLPSLGIRAQQAPSPDSLVRLLSSMQQRQDDFYFKGTFPVYRRYGRSEKLKPDNSIFFTGLVALVLTQVRDALPPDARPLADSIVSRAVSSYVHFRNPSGAPTYNFWRAEPPLVFPNSWFLNHFNQSNQLPDDLDDTAILWLTMDAPDSTARRVKALMEAHANGMMGRIRNTLPGYRDLPAYSTWFGVKMPVDFDFCVMCNVLYFAATYGLPFTVQDSASVEYIRRVIVTGQWRSRAAFVSPHYGRPPVLLYHVSRLLTRLHVPALDTLKPVLLAEAREAYHRSDNWLDSVLLSTTVIRLGGTPPPLPRFSEAALEEHMPAFFVASFSAYMPGIFKKMLLGSQVIKYYFSCPAYRAALYLENRLLR